MSGNLTSVFQNKNLYSIFGITLMAVMGVSSITPAFPEIIRHFGISATQVGWLIVVFTLPGIFLTPVAGVLADRLGRKKILIPSLILFGFAGFACVFTSQFFWLLFWRFLQGVGASSLSGLSLTLIGDIFSGNQRTNVMGYNASVLSIGTASYPALGGVIASFGWKYIFILPLLSVVLAIFIVFSLKNPEPISKKGLKEYFGNVWKAVNRKTVWGLFISNILVFVILYGAFLTYFPLLLENRLQVGPLAIGIMTSLMSLVTAATSFSLGRISKWLRPKQQIIIAAFAYGVSMMILTGAGSWLLLTLSVIIFGLGHGIMIPSIQNLLLSLSSINERAAFISLNSMVLKIGQSAGPLLIGFFYTLGGLSGAFAAGAIIAVTIIGILLATVKLPAPENQD